MKARKFWTGLIIISVVTFGLILLVHRIESMQAFLDHSILSLGFMIATTIVMYFLGKAALKSSNQYAFIQLVIASVLVKIVLALGLNMVYVKIVKPDYKYFILPFIIIYIIYTIFETYALFKMALKKPNIDHE